MKIYRGFKLGFCGFVLPSFISFFNFKGTATHFWETCDQNAQIQKRGPKCLQDTLLVVEHLEIRYWGWSIVHTRHHKQRIFQTRKWTRQLQQTGYAFPSCVSGDTHVGKAYPTSASSSAEPCRSDSPGDFSPDFQLLGSPTSINFHLSSIYEQNRIIVLYNPMALI